MQQILRNRRHAFTDKAYLNPLLGLAIACASVAIACAALSIITLWLSGLYFHVLQRTRRGLALPILMILLRLVICK